MKAGGREDGEPVGQSDSIEDDNYDPDMDDFVPPDAADVLELTTEEKELRKKCTWEIFTTLPLPEPGVTELPKPWSFLNFMDQGEAVEDQWALDAHMLQAYTILQHEDNGNGQHETSAVEMESMFHSFQLMERLACFPHMHTLNDGGEPVKGKDASPTRLQQYYAFRREQTERDVAILREKSPDQRLLAVMYATMYFCSVAIRCIDNR